MAEMMTYQIGSFVFHPTFLYRNVMCYELVQPAIHDLSLCHQRQILFEGHGVAAHIQYSTTLKSSSCRCRLFHTLWSVLRDGVQVPIHSLFVPVDCIRPHRRLHRLDRGIHRTYTSTSVARSTACENEHMCRGYVFVLVPPKMLC